MTASVEQMRLSPNRLKDLENQLFSLARTQSKRQTPTDLPSPLFWDQLTQLVQHIEIELDEAMRRDGWGAKTQMLQRRQGNVRRAIGELTRNRLNAFVGHATMVQLSGEGAAANATSIDWTRHTPAERAFHDGVARLVDRYKADIDWRQLQRGLVASQAEVPSTPSGTAPLTQFTDTIRPAAANSLSTLDNPLDNSKPKSDFSSESVSRLDFNSDGLTKGNEMIEPLSNRPNPSSDPDGFVEPPADWHDDDFDFEPEPFEPEPIQTTSNPTEAKGAQATSDQTNSPQTTADQNTADQTKSPEPEPESMDEASKQGENESSEESSRDMIRIRILKDLPEPLIDESGDEIELLDGDVHQCAALLGETLISAGFAEEAPI